MIRKSIPSASKQPASSSAQYSGQPIAEVGEFGLIQRIRVACEVTEPDSGLLRGIGDDAAILQPREGYRCLWSTDMLFEGIHFDLSYVPLQHLGYKAMMLNVSDIAAMNGLPRYALVGLGLSNRFSVEDVEQLYQGLRLAAQEMQVRIVGGDTTSSRLGMCLSLSLLGEVKPEACVTRDGAQVGDCLCVTGDLGAAYLGFSALQRGQKEFLNTNAQPDLGAHKYVIQRYLKPSARTDIVSMFLSHKLLPSSMIDISDGLCSEVLHLCKASQVGVVLEEEKIPIASDSLSSADVLSVDPLVAACHGGEDYELLFTLPESSYEKMKSWASITRIGHIQAAEDGLYIYHSSGKKVPIQAKGWDHFSKA